MLVGTLRFRWREPNYNLRIQLERERSAVRRIGLSDDFIDSGEERRDDCEAEFFCGLEPMISTTSGSRTHRSGCVNPGTLDHPDTAPSNFMRNCFGFIFVRSETRSEFSGYQNSSERWSCVTYIEIDTQS
jgi:hypothetical protein